MTFRDDMPDSDDLDLETVRNLLEEWDREWQENGDDWIAPGIWWHQRINLLALRLDTKVNLDRVRGDP